MIMKKDSDFYGADRRYLLGKGHLKQDTGLNFL
jgi:hypothetical protein